MISISEYFIPFTNIGTNLKNHDKINYKQNNVN